MTDRKSLKIRQPTADRFESWQRQNESQTDALARLLDEAGVPRRLYCAECGESVQKHARDDDGTIYCLDCAGVDPAQLP